MDYEEFVDGMGRSSTPTLAHSLGAAIAVPFGARDVSTITVHGGSFHAPIQSNELEYFGQRGLPWGCSPLRGACG